ncbi:MAG: flagellar FliJ family protein [Phycisphaerales bacterium]
MSRFRFPWETLLAVRRREEQAQQATLARLQGRSREIAEAMEAGRHALDAGREALRGALTGRVDGAAVRMEAQNALVLQRRLRAAGAELAAANRAAEQARRTLADAARERRAVELLREARLRAHLEAQARREQAAMDEVAARVGGEA